MQFSRDFQRASEFDGDNPLGDQYFYDSNSQSFFPSLEAKEGRELFNQLLSDSKLQVKAHLERVFFRTAIGKSLKNSHPRWIVELEIKHFSLVEQTNARPESEDEIGFSPYVFTYAVKLRIPG